MQERGEVAEEELRALEEDITGRVSLFSTSTASPDLTSMFARSCLRRGEAPASRLSMSCARSVSLYALFRFVFLTKTAGLRQGPEGP